MIVIIGLFIISSIHAENLYHENTFQSLVSDHRALKVGDILTVLIVENSNAQTRINSQGERSFNIGLNANYKTTPFSAKGGLSAGDQGGGQTSRGQAVKAALTVTIIGKTPNNDWRIRGSQKIRVNREEQVIQLGGVIRPEDISSDNSVLSSRIAEAKIVYSGEGDLTNSAKHNIFYRLFTWLGLI